MAECNANRNGLVDAAKHLKKPPHELARGVHIPVMKKVADAKEIPANEVRQCKIHGNSDTNIRMVRTIRIDTNNSYSLVLFSKFACPHRRYVRANTLVSHD